MSNTRRQLISNRFSTSSSMRLEKIDLNFWGGNSDERILKLENIGQTSVTNVLSIINSKKDHNCDKQILYVKTYTTYQQ
jgi:hypothetical protein